MGYLKQLLQVLIALDQLLNALIGLIAYPFSQTIFWADETISSMCYRAHRDGKWYGIFMHLINVLFFWQADYGRFYWRGYHCEEAYQSERNNRQLPPEFRY
ncbi:hypothetical protein [Neptuniibacter sp.]|uniref:hypothetical protein n=1 Tax=Neptuniibacter sp. TaxID=1962643 RepID=UPI002607743B|nr:hypothetical protein [Neptuniibacter sp.]MCP4597783.1 pseudouridine synthase [Neptuniibacter sp.]